MKKLAWLIIVLVTSYEVSAQHIRPLKAITDDLDVNDLRLIAERLYHEKYYYAALEYFNRLEKQSELSHSEQSKLAKIKYIVKDYQGAGLLYQQLEGSDPEISFQLGNLYKILGDPNKASLVFRKAIENPSSSAQLKNRARYQLGTISLLDKIQNSVDRNTNLTLQHSASAGVRSSRFTPNGSQIGDAGIDLRIKKKIKINSDLTVELDTILIHRLYQKQKGEFKALLIPLKVPSLSLANAATGVTSNQILFDAYDVLNPKSTYAIHTSEFNWDTWSEPKKISPRINVSDYDSRDPMMARTAAGECFLFFSSNRPGGFGGYDIWVSRYVQGEFTVAINLGAGVNTTEDERAPFFDVSTGYLFFSSNGHAGLGAMDIFLTRVNWGKGRGKTFNLGRPYNSAFDDTHFNLSKEGKKGMLTSNRDELCCDQTYGFDLATPFSYSELPGQFIEVMVFDQFDTDLMVLRQSFNYEKLAFNKTQTEFILNEDANLEGTLFKDQSVLANRKVLLIDKKGEVISSTISDRQGKFKFKQLPSGGQYSFIMDQKDTDLTVDVKLVNKRGEVFGRLNSRERPGVFGYRPLEDYVAGVWLLDVEDATISGELISSAVKGEKIVLVDDQGRIVAVTQTDRKGRFSFTKLPAGKRYAFVLRAVDRPINVNVDITDELGNVVQSFNSTTSKELFKYRVLEDYQAGVWNLKAKDGTISGSLVVGTLAIGNKKVLLMDENGEVVGVSYTDGGGVFTFKKLPAGNRFSFVIEESEAEFNIDVAVFDEKGNIVTRFSNNNRQEVFKYNTLKAYDEGLYAVSVKDAVFKGSVVRADAGLDGHFLALADATGEILQLVQTDKYGNFEFTELTKGQKYNFILPSGSEELKVEIKVLDLSNRLLAILDNQLNKELFSYKDLTPLIEIYYAQNSTICGQFEPLGTQSHTLLLVDENNHEIACVEANGHGYFQIDNIPFTTGHRFVLEGCSSEAELKIEVVNAIGATTFLINSEEDTNYFLYKDLNLFIYTSGFRDLNAILRSQNPTWFALANFELPRC